MPLNVLILDDDAGMRLVLRKLIERTEGFTVVDEAQNGEEGLELFAQLRPQVVFLDIEMPGLNGVECAQRIQDIDPHAALVFATAHEGYMDKAFELYAFDYMLKPFKNERVFSTLKRIATLLSTEPDEENEPDEAQAPLPVPQNTPAVPAKRQNRMFIRNRDGVSMVSMEDVILVQRENRQTVLYTATGSYSTNETLTDMENRLDKDQFFRSHKSYIINLSMIDSITPYGRWTYVVRFKGIKQDALITHEKYEQLESMFG